MPKKMHANRKFLEEQVKIALEQYTPQLALPDAKFQLDKYTQMLKTIAAGIVDTFIPIGKKVLQGFFYGGSKSMALGRLKFPENSGEKNLQELKSVKEFFSLFDQEGSSNQNIKNALIYKPSEALKNYLLRAKRSGSIQSGRINLKNRKTYNAEVYEKLYDWIYTNNKVVGRDSARKLKNIKVLIASKNSLRRDNFFKNAARARIDNVEVFSLLILAPIYNTLGSSLVSEMLNESSPGKILGDYREAFVATLTDNKLVTFVAFSIASKIDPAADHSLSQWWHVVNKAAQKNNFDLAEISYNKLIKAVGTIVASWNIWGAEFAVMVGALRKVPKMPKNGIYLFSIALILFLVYALVDPLGKIEKKLEIPRIIRKASEKINQIRRNNYANQTKWAFTEQENEEWRKKILQIVDLIKEQFKSRVLESPFGDQKQKLALLEAFYETANKIYTEIDQGVNSNNVDDVIKSLNEIEKIAQEGYDKFRVNFTSFLPFNLEESKKQIFIEQNENTLSLSEEIKEGLDKYGTKYKLNYVEETKKVFISIINGYKLKRAGLNVKFQEVKKIFEDFEEYTEVSPSQAHQNFSDSFSKIVASLKTPPKDATPMSQLDLGKSIFQPAYLKNKLGYKIQFFGQGGIFKQQAKPIKAFFIPIADRGMRNSSFFYLSSDSKALQLAVKVIDPNFSTGDNPGFFMSLRDSGYLTGGADSVKEIQSLGINDQETFTKTFKKFYEPGNQIDQAIKAGSTGSDEKNWLILMRGMVKIHELFLYRFENSVLPLIVKEQNLSLELLKKEVELDKAIKTFPWKPSDDKKRTPEQTDEMDKIILKAVSEKEKLAIEKMSIAKGLADLDSNLSEKQITIIKFL